TFRGGSLPASGIPWLRAREVAVHTVDLDAGVGFGDLPPDLVAALVREIVDKRLTDGEGPALAAWLTGRSTGPTALAPWRRRTPRPARVRCRRPGRCRTSPALRSGRHGTTAAGRVRRSAPGRRGRCSRAAPPSATARGSGGSRGRRPAPPGVGCRPRRTPAGAPAGWRSTRPPAR